MGYNVPFDGGRLLKSILVANRGEIACRVFRTAREMGLRTIAVYTDPDADSPHVAEADAAAKISDYLSISEIIETAKNCGAQFIHPGYGFLSENPRFAFACREAGVTFVGPSPEAMEAIGDKGRAHVIARQIGIPVADTAGPFHGAQEIENAARNMGPPLMLKAAAGGGGKGMKRLLVLDNLQQQIEAAQRETGAAFGDTRLIVERYVYPARHVEVQIFGDGKRAIALGERECSLQRRHQKIIEESPSTAVNEFLRNRLFESAIKLAEAVGYFNACTVEFLLDPDGNFYFLEVNTRLQVEHPVTEMRTGLDLVRMQIELAFGEKLIKQEDVTSSGHAIEARLNAEDPWNNFLPSAGKVLYLRFPPSVRVDSGVGTQIGTRYDSLLAKLIAKSNTREEARIALIKALEETVVLGVYTNQTFLIHLLSSDFFRDGKTFTTTVDEMQIPKRHIPEDLMMAAALSFQGPIRHPHPLWDVLKGWRLH